MAKRKRTSSEPEHEYWSMGPLRMERFGTHTLLANTATPAQHAEMQMKAAARYPQVVADIDRLVGEIATLVSELPPDQLLQQAWWATARGRTQKQAESELTADDGVALRMIDYVQSVVASYPRSATQRQINKDDFAILRAAVGQLFQLVNFDLIVCTTARAQADGREIDLSFEEFKVKAHLYWCNVRGHRYQAHEPAYLRDVFLPHNSIFVELFGITAEHFIQEATKIVRNFAIGIIGGALEIGQLQQDVMSAVQQKMKSPRHHREDVAALMRQVIQERGWQKRTQDIFGRVIGMDGFDVQRIADLPKALLDSMAWSPGEERTFFGPGKERGWPTRVWPISLRPLIRLDGKYYCFDHYSLFDNLYRMMQRIIQERKPSYKQKWNEIQKQTSEDLPFSYLRRILNGALEYRGVHYPIGDGNWSEVDGLLIFDDNLFVIEVKAGAFILAPPSTNLDAYVQSLERLVLAPVAQGRRFLKYLHSAESVDLYDDKHNKIGSVTRRKFRRITICAVTLDRMTELAARIQHLRNVGVDVGEDPVWSVSIDDLRVYADVFDNSLAFLHYVEQRMEAFKSGRIELEDELDHLGMYLRHNHYATYAKELYNTDKKVRFTFSGYRDDIDRFFQERLHDPNAPCLLRQQVPFRLLEIVEYLATTDKVGRALVVSTLLDLNSEWRDKISEAIDQELARDLRPLPRAISSGGGVDITIYCWRSGMEKDPDFVREYTHAIMLLHGNHTRLVLELQYTAGKTLVDVTCAWLKSNELPAQDKARIAALAAEIRNARDERAGHKARHPQQTQSSRAGSTKPGRNSLCICGSGKKYKRCCLEK